MFHLLLTSKVKKTVSCHMKLRHWVSGSRRLEWSYFRKVVNCLYIDASYSRRMDSSPELTSASRRCNCDPSKRGKLSPKNRHRRKNLNFATFISLSNLGKNLKAVLYIYIYISVTYMLHGSIKYSIFMSNKNTIHHWVNFLLHNSCPVRQVEDVKLLKEHVLVGFKSTTNSLQGLQDLRKFSFTNLFWALSNMEAVSKNLLCTLALNVTCTAKTQNGIGRNQILDQLFWILRSYSLFILLGSQFNDASLTTELRICSQIHLQGQYFVL